MDISRLLQPKGSNSPDSTSSFKVETAAAPRGCVVAQPLPSPQIESYSTGERPQSLSTQASELTTSPTAYGPASSEAIYTTPRAVDSDYTTSLIASKHQAHVTTIAIPSLKRQASSEPHPFERGAKKQSKWSAEENDRIIALRGSGMKWEDVSRQLPGRSAISCRLHYQNFLERRPEWDEEKKNKLARLYER